MTKLHLVTGGAGYFGTVLVQRLHDQGHGVRIFDIHDADERPAGVEMFRGDIRDPEAVARACEGVAVVHHNVAMVPLAKDAGAFWSVNEGGTKNLLEAALRERVAKVVHMSSSAVFGVPARNPVDDTVEPRPQEEYGRAKLAAEALVHDYVARGLDVTIIRPRTIMGHGRLGIMQILFEWIREGKNVPVFGRGDNLYQFVHADDLADAAIRAGERAGAAVYNVGAEKFGTMRETLESLIAHAGTGSRIVSVPAAPAVAMMNVTSKLGVSPLGAYHSLMYGREMYFDLTRTKRELGWAPRFSNAEMFAESYDWYVAHRAEVLGRHHASHHRSPVKQGVLRAVSVGLSVLPSIRA
ncbi:MAG TPA: NAD-dependent epimerase/dehydratase family protein [Kofleriaceae bacterium]|nr:NAD-dependent epimerase/dehydratase family protein [Kofleriaceae bacterium]